MKRGAWLRAGAGAAALVTAGAVAGYVLAATPRTEAHRAATASAPEPSELFVDVVPGPLVEEWPAVVSVGLSGKGTVTLQQPSEAGRAVVSWLPPDGSSQVSHGEAVVAVSGRPVLALQGRVPAFRDLTIGAKGDDVTQLHLALCLAGAGCPSGDVFTAETTRAVEALYASAGYVPLTSDGDALVPWSELLFVPDLPVLLDTSGARWGQDAEEATLTYGSGSWRPVFADESSPPGRGWSGKLRGCSLAGTTIRDGRFVDPGDLATAPFDRRTRCDVVLRRRVGPRGSWVVPASAVATTRGTTVVHLRTAGEVTDVEIDVQGESGGQVVVLSEEDLGQGEVEIFLD